MRDDALAPVIAVMLILAAIVTFLSIWNAVYVPAMKQSGEVGHLQNVESAFQHFSADIDYAVSSHQDHISFSEPVQLGGGDIMVNLLKSSGTLSVQDENIPIYTLNLTDGTGTPVALVNGTMVNFSYEPTNNFWQDQGYRWQDGYINVTKYGILSTPLGYYTMTDVENNFNTSGSPLMTFAESFGSVNYIINQSSGGNCSSLDLWATNISSSPDRTFVSSNGFGTLRLTSALNATSFADIADISYGSDNSLFSNGILDSWNASFGEIQAACPDNIVYDPVDSNGNYRQWHILQTVSPVTVNLHMVKVEIGVY
ncbi:MAG: hypothetical protein ACLQMU_12220 [Methanoregula sp.]|uniref:hypothetical protein n=1 Tax=Methanoregula sp. TaxID=2052170 RepID=UPI003C4CEE99